MRSETDFSESRAVSRLWYAVFAAGLFFLNDALTKGARLDGMPIFALGVLTFFSVAAIKVQQIFAPAESVWGGVPGRDALLLALAVLLMQGGWHWLGWEHRTISDGVGVMALLAILVIGPMFEEILFRGLAFKAFSFGKTRTAVSAQIALSSVAFAVYHTDYWGSLSLGLVLAAGVIFGIARHRSGGILLPILLHALMNGIALGVSVFI